MKIIHLSCIAPPEIGGMGRVAALEVRGLRGRGVDALLVAPAAKQSPSREAHDEGVRRLPMYWRAGNASALRYDLLHECVRDANLVHLHYPFYGTAGMVAQLRRRGVIKRLVMTLHMDATARGMKGLYFDVHRKIAQPQILKMADALLVSSRDYARHSSFAPFVDRCIELPFGVDEKKFSPGRPPSGRPQGSPLLPSTVYRLLFVGGMDKAHAFKGVDVLLRAMAWLHPLPSPSPFVRGRGYELLLVGDGDLRAGYERMATELGIAGRVMFLGRVSDEELPDVYRSADILAFPSISGAEAFGLAALEAQSSGVPVVASDLPGVRTVVSNGETGFLVPPGDARALAERLKYLLDHDDVRHAMGNRARARVLERFTWTKHIDGLIAVYRDVMR